MSNPTHAKSKTGCRTCKARKVKCDENRPVCRNCVKYGAKCEFASSSAQSSLLPRSSVDSTPSTLAQFSLIDLELLHHYTTSTCLTLSAEPQTRMFWKVKVPQIGFSNPFVLRSVLAIAAQHCAHLKPGENNAYLAHAQACHDDATSTMQAFADVTEENYPALISFTWLNIYYAFARPKETDSLLVVDRGVVPDWLILFRGVRGLTEMGADATRFSSLVDFATQTAIQTNRLWESSTYENDALCELQSNFETHVTDESKINVLRNAIRDLGRSFSFIFEGLFPEEYKLRSAFIWLYKMSDSYMDLLKANDNEALCILAFFCVVLKRLDCYWWMEGWAWHLIRLIHGVLKPSHRMWIQWSMEEVGWAPT